MVVFQVPLAVAVAASALNFYSQTVFTNTTRRLARLVTVCLQLEVITDHAITCRFCSRPSRAVQKELQSEEVQRMAGDVDILGIKFGRWIPG